MEVKSPEIIIVTGGSGGLGRALITSLLERFSQCSIHATYLRTSAPFKHARVQWHQLDVTDGNKIEAFASQYDKADWVINAVGMLHNTHQGPEKRIRALDENFLFENIRINTLPTVLLAKHFDKAFLQSEAPLLATLSARVGSIEDNRLGGWYSYRASKAALNMVLKTLSVEWHRSHPGGCVVAIHPGTNDTALSRPFQANVKPGQLFEPEYSAELMVKLLSELDVSKSGSFMAWDGTEIPW